MECVPPSCEYQAEGFGMLPSILQTYARGGGGLMAPPEPEPQPEVEREIEREIERETERERKVAEVPLATAARLHVQHASGQSRELFA